MANMPTENEPLTFIFGDAKSHAAQEAIRVHVMRRQHRHRKLQRQQQLGVTGVEPSASGSPNITSMLLDTATDSSKLSTRFAVSEHAIKRASKPPHRSEMISGKNSLVESLNLPHHPSVTSLFRQQTGPVERRCIRSAEYTLIEYYLECMGVSSLSVNLVGMYSETLATYSMFLAIIATRIAQDRGFRGPIDPAELESLAMREVARQLPESSQTPAMGTMLAVALFAHLREAQNAFEETRLHWDALRRMIDINGGLESLRKAADLYTMIFWTEGVVLSNVPYSIGQRRDDFDAVLNPTSEVLRFFEDVNASMASTQMPDGQSIHTLTEPITQTLSRPVCRVQLFSFNEWRQAKLACLVYFTVVALAFNEAVQNTNVYTTIEGEVLERGRSYIVRPEELYYVLMQTDALNETFDLAPKVARLVNAIKRFDHDDKCTSYRLLSSFLGYIDPWGTNMVCQNN